MRTRGEMTQGKDPDVPPDSARGLSRYFLGFAWVARQLHYRRQSAGSVRSP